MQREKSQYLLYYNNIWSIHFHFLFYICSLFIIIIIIILNNLYTGALIQLKKYKYILTVLPTSPVYDFKKLKNQKE